jgi:shikimate dehydrogenase
MRPDDFSPQSVSYISGRTRLYGIVGHPIAQVRSPEFVTHELVSRGIDSIVLPIHVAPERFEELLPAIMAIANLDGLIVTVPYKARATRFMQSLGPQAQITGTVSVMAKRDTGWIGEMFDGLGCVAALRRRDITIAGSRVALLGVGGAGSAIGVALASQAPRSLRIVDPDVARAQASALLLRQAFPGVDIDVAVGGLDFDRFDILINASPIGMLDPDACPLQVETLPPHLAVMDIVMKPDETRLLRTAIESGCRVVYGREMLGSQLSAVVDFLMPPRADRQR